MKTADRRNRIVIVYLILALSLLAFGRLALAEEPAAQPAPSSKTQAPSSCEPRAGGHQIPNDRRLSPENAAWLGNLVWDALQQKADPKLPDLSEAQIRALFDDARRNRQELTVTIDELFQLMESPAFCPQPAAAEPEKAGAWGVDLRRIR